MTVKLSDKDLDPMLKKLHLANTRRTWKETVDRAEKEDWSCRDFLALLVTEEVAHREQTRIMRSVRKAGFPFLKTIEEYDFSLRSNIRRSLFGSYLSSELVSDGRNLILMGKTGRGKTHLAISIAYRAIQNGFTAKFTTAAILIEELSEASKEGKLRQALKEYVSPSVLVIDEVGYLTYGPDAANVLFHVVNERHILNRPILFTTNKSPFEEWGDALHDKDLAEAIVDRVLEKGRIVVLDGPSARTRHLERSKDQNAKIDKPARISGIKRVGSKRGAFEHFLVGPALGRFITVSSGSRSPRSATTNWACGFPAPSSSDRILHQGLCDLSTGEAFAVVSDPVIRIQTQDRVYPSATPPRPAKALALSRTHHVPTHLLFHPETDPSKGL
jgi:DNA replication protein DnaC